MNDKYTQRCAQKVLTQLVLYALIPTVLHTVMDGECVAAVMIQDMVWLLTLLTTSVQNVFGMVELSLYS